MEMSLYSLSNIILFIVCITIGIVFLSFPTPKIEELKNYKISLKVLATSYILLAILTFITIFFKLPDNSRELFTFTNITISSFQAFLFANAIITLLNPLFVTRRYLIIQSIPFVLLLALFGFSYSAYGNPVITHFNEIGMHLNKPTLWARLLFYAYYAFQIVIYTWLYINQEKKYRAQALNYFSDEVWIKLSWVRIAYLAALIIGLISLSAYWVPKKWDWAFNFIYAVFYLGFGVEYVKYNKIYHQLQPNLMLKKQNKADTEQPKRSKSNWTDLKSQIITNQYFLESGITIEALASRLQVGRTTLSNCINREEGVNFNTWINGLRIEKAKELLLKKPELSISIISEKVGYSEQANFSRQFRAITGYAPSLWRQKHIQNIPE